MANAPAKVTRTELVVIIAALAVLLLWNRAPEPGSANVRTDAGPATLDLQNADQPAWPDNQPPSEETQPALVRTTAVETQGPDEAAREVPPAESIPPMQPKPKQYGRVDARNCESLSHKGVMYGEIKVRYVWDGSRFVFRKVCEVKEPGGGTSVWSFDDVHEGLVVSELAPGEVPPQ